MHKKFIYISSRKQEMCCYEGTTLSQSYRVSTGKNGIGEITDSQKTPRGWHEIKDLIGADAAINSVFVGRVWTGEIYSPELAKISNDRDWILTRIIRLSGLEPRRNQGGDVDTYARMIYIHGTPDETMLGVPGSHGCIRMRNQDILKLFEWVDSATLVFIT